MQPELYQNHGDHIEAIMPTQQFIENHLQQIISNSEFFQKVKTEVSDEEMKNQLTDVFSLKHNEGDMNMLTLLAYSPKRQVNMFMSVYPLLKGNVVKLKVEKVYEWFNQVEATIICSVGDFEFAFFATDYYANKQSYSVGNELEIELAALACQFEEAQRGFTFEGQQAIDWLAKMGEQPTYNDKGEVEPIHFSMEKLVAYINHDEKCPDEAEFQSPISHISSTSLLKIDFYKGDIVIHRDDETDAEIVVPIYFRKDFFSNVQESDPVRGWLWLTGQLSI